MEHSMKITDEKVTEYIDGLYRPLNPFLAGLRRSAEKELIPIILKDTETMLLTLLKIKKPSHILEIGTAVGYSALCFAFAAPGTQIVTLELQEKLCHAARINFEKANCSARIRIMEGDALTSLEKLSEQVLRGELPAFDFVFIDGAKGHYQKVWDRCMRLCEPGAVIVSDNILYRAMTAADEYLDTRRNKTIVGRMRSYLKHITELPDIQTTVLPVGDGVAVSVLKGETNEEN